MVMSADLFFESNCELAEGPVFCNGWLLFVDITGKEIHRVCTESQKWERFALDEMVGSFAVDYDNPDKLLVAKTKSIVTLTMSERSEEIVSQPESKLGMRYNDGKCDAYGRFFVGSMYHEEGEEKHIGSLYFICPRTLTSVLVESGVGVSNGLAWSLDNKILYYIDSLKRVVYAYDYDIEKGALTNRRIAIAVPPALGYPDGMTIDKEGKLWVAHWDGWAVRRWDPLTGECLQEIKLPCARVSSVCWGGDNMSDLYITTARRGLTKEALEAQPHAGDIFVVRRLHPGGFELHKFGSREAGVCN